MFAPSNESMCQQVLFISSLDGNIVATFGCLSMAANLLFIIICLVQCDPINDDDRRLAKWKEDSPEGVKERERRFVMATAIKYCAADASFGMLLAVLMMVVSLAPLPVTCMIVVNAGRDICNGKMVEKERRWSEWILYFGLFWMVSYAILKALQQARPFLKSTREARYFTVVVDEEQQQEEPPQYTETTSVDGLTRSDVEATDPMSATEIDPAGPVASSISQSLPLPKQNPCAADEAVVW
ncbi:hypothetical protein MMC13_002889 [Lambiella insularis]|nr:hypothetical protein [Lambiella insularis]